MAVTVGCVLRSGGEYHPEHVLALKDGVERHLPSARFVCLSDREVAGVECVRLRHNWPGWWSKMEVFRPGALEGRVLYLDLDSVIVGDLSEIASYAGEFAMIDDFYRPHLAQSGLMAFRAGPGMAAAGLYESFSERAGEYMRGWRGDGEWLREHMGAPDRLSSLYPNQIVSFKRHCRRSGVPRGARIVAFHGQPRPWDPDVRLTFQSDRKETA